MSILHVRSKGNARGAGRGAVARLSGKIEAPSRKISINSGKRLCFVSSVFCSVVKRLLKTIVF